MKLSAGDRPTHEEFLENLAAAAQSLQEKLPQVRAPPAALIRSRVERDAVFSMVLIWASTRRCSASCPHAAVLQRFLAADEPADITSSLRDGWVCCAAGAGVPGRQDCGGAMTRVRVWLLDLHEVSRFGRLSS